MAFVNDHDLSYRGDFPCNTHGGQLAFGQAGAAGGMTQVVEAVRQIQGRAGDRQLRQPRPRLRHRDRRGDERAERTGARGSMSPTEETAAPRPPRPVITPAGRPFWDGLREHRLLIQRCEGCRSWIHYPRVRCPRCGCGHLVFEPAAPHGRHLLVHHCPSGDGPALRRRGATADRDRRARLRRPHDEQSRHRRSHSPGGGPGSRWGLRRRGRRDHPHPVPSGCSIEPELSRVARDHIGS